MTKICDLVSEKNGGFPMYYVITFLKHKIIGGYRFIEKLNMCLVSVVM